MKAVNQTLISLYWGIGQEIYNQQNEKGWGKSIVEVLAKEIQKDFERLMKEAGCYFATAEETKKLKSIDYDEEYDLYYMSFCDWNYAIDLNNGDRILLCSDDYGKTISTIGYDFTFQPMLYYS